MIETGTNLGGKYRVVRRLGEGSMGTVYEAEHPRIGRRVAIKLLHERFGRSERAIQRFMHEARAAGAVGHANIVEATDFGTHKGLPFIVMELLRGEALAERLSHDLRVAPTEAVRIVGQVLSALASAHAAGIVHRDLKPENIFLLQRGATRDIVKLLDFGLSKFRRSDGSSRIETQEGVLMGTPAYMAPEQWMGRRDTDHRADLFACGVVLYEMLVGRLPFVGETQGELFQVIVNGTDDPRSPSSVVRTVPEGLDAVVLRALKRDRDQRYQTAKEFLDALVPFGAEGIMAVDAPPASLALEDADTTFRVQPSTTNEPTRSVERRKNWLAWVPGVAVPLALASMIFAVVGRGPRSAPSEVAREQQRPRRTAASGSAPSQAPPRAPVAGAPRDTTADVRVELRGLPTDAIVRMDGILQDSNVLSVARSDVQRRIEVQRGAARRTIEIVPDRDQVFVVDLASVDTATRPATGGGGATAAGGSSRAGAHTPRSGTGAPTGRPRGIGVMGVSNVF